MTVDSAAIAPSIGIFPLGGDLRPMIGYFTWPAQFIDLSFLMQDQIENWIFNFYRFEFTRVEILISRRFISSRSRARARADPIKSIVCIGLNQITTARHISQVAMQIVSEGFNVSRKRS